MLHTIGILLVLTSLCSLACRPDVLWRLWHTPAAGEARQHNGNVYNTNTYTYPLRQRRSDEALRGLKLNEPLSKAAAEGQTRRVRVLVERGADPDHADGNELTALHHAAFSGFEDTVAALLDMAVDINAHSKYYGTPLCLAALKGRLEVVKLLLSHRINIEADGGRLGSALHAASFGACWEIVDALLDAGAAIHLVKIVCLDYLKDPLGSHPPNTSKECFKGQPVYVAALGDGLSTQVVLEILLDRGAEVDAIGSKWRSKDDQQGMIDMRKRNHHFRNCTPLMVAADKALAPVVECLLTKEANANARRSDGKLALVIATARATDQRYERSTTHFVLRKGASLEASGAGDSKTPLILAAQRGNPYLLKQFIERRALLEAQSTSHRTALSYAAKNGHAKCVRILLKAGAVVDSIADLARTPLMEAAERGHMNTVKLLLKAGADSGRSDSTGSTVLVMAAKGNHVDIVEILGLPSHDRALYHGDDLDLSGNSPETSGDADSLCDD